MRLSRKVENAGRPAAPIRIVHIGLGNFHRAHQAFYTEHASDADEWGIAAFTGRSAGAAEELAPQDGLFTLIVRGPEGDAPEVISSLSAVHAAADHEAYLTYLADPQVVILTSTVTEHGYCRGADGNLDQDAVADDVAALKADPRQRVASLPARLVAGFLARRETLGEGDQARFTVLPCDNLPSNGAVTAALVRELAELVDPSLVGWIDAHVEFATCMVDRITPATTDEDRASVEEQCGWQDISPVPTEPFTELVIEGDFAAGRPDWESAGVEIVEDVEPFEQRKLWLLNGSHTLMAYAGSVLGHRTIDEAIADERVRGWVQDYWAEASAHLSLPADSVTAYQLALLERYENPRIRHLLAQIAHDGSAKLPIRIIPTARAERAAGNSAQGCQRAIAAWVLHLRGVGAPVKDPGAPLGAANDKPLADAVAAMVASLDAELGADEEFVSAVVAAAEELETLAG